MSAFDKPPSYYQHNDIVDPTPYEKEPEDLGFDCAFCGDPIRRGDKIVVMSHTALVCDVVMHRLCLNQRAGGRDTAEKAMSALEDLGFEFEEGVVK